MNRLEYAQKALDAAKAQQVRAEEARLAWKAEMDAVDAFLETARKAIALADADEEVAEGAPV